MAKELDDEQIKKLLAPRKTVGTRKKAQDLTLEENRNIKVWFTLMHRLDTCSNPECPDSRPLKTEDGNAMCVQVEGVVMCRLCFLDNYPGRVLP